MMLILLFGFAAFCLVVHLGTLGIAWMRCRPASGRPAEGAALPPVTVVRPLCGIETFSRQTIDAAFALDYPRFELLFCVADGNDKIVPLVREAITAHPGVAARLLVGNDPISTNPKLNNMVKGWREAAHDWIAFIDSNVLVPPDFVRKVAGAWRADTGLVSAPPVGVMPRGFGGHLECAFLNTHEARWQYAVDTCMQGFAQGKTLYYRKADLDRSGMRDLAAEPAEDAATTKMVRRMGLRVRLAPPSPQPLGARQLREVWRRQLRWARLRRATFPLEFLPEILSGGFVPILCMAAAVALAGTTPVWLAAYVGLWYAAELALAGACRWPFGWQTPLTIVLRDLLMPALWVGAFTGRSYTWMGAAMQIESRPRNPLDPALHQEKNA